MFHDSKAQKIISRTWPNPRFCLRLDRQTIIDLFRGHATNDVLPLLGGHLLKEGCRHCFYNQYFLGDAALI